MDFRVLITHLPHVLAPVICAMPVIATTMPIRDALTAHLTTRFGLIVRASTRSGQIVRTSTRSRPVVRTSLHLKHPGRLGWAWRGAALNLKL